MAQKKKFTLEDLNFGGTNYYHMLPENRYTTWWGDKLVRTDMEACSLVGLRNAKQSTLFTLQDVAKASRADSLKVRSLYNVRFPYASKSIAVIGLENGVVWFDFKKHAIIKSYVYPSNLQAKEWCYKSQMLAMVENNQLCVLDAKGNKHTITTDGSSDIVYGQSVHRDEFGYDKGTFWSPDGIKLMFTRMDQSMVTSYPLVNIPEIDWTPAAGQSRIATAAPIKYPMAGEKMHKVTIGIYNTQNGKTIYLDAGDPTDRYFTNPAWSPDGTTVYLFELNRDQNDCRLVSYDAATGKKIKELYRETDSKYVEPLHPIVFLPWDDSKFIMQSQKDGYNHFYLFDKEGNQLKQITKGPWVVMDFLGFYTKRHAIVYASNELSPIQKNIWVVDVESGKRALMSDDRGWHEAQLSGSGAYVCDHFQAPDVPRKIDIISLEDANRTSYLTAADPWKDYEVPEYSCGTLKAADGKTDLYYRMVKPVGFDPTKKYPTVVYVYGGPHAHNVDARWHWGSRSWETYMAQKGYLLFILDNRGSENRGKDFEQVTFRHLGQEEMKDQMEGVKFLKSLPYVDSTRIGVHGWSFGGFMTISLITNYPDVFKVAVAGGPVIDWKWYEVMYGERYMDTPQTNPEGYKQTSLLSKAKDLKGKLQIIIGGDDPVVVPQHALSFIKACIAAGTQPDFFVYPGEPHNMRGHQSVHLHERITQYFEDYLK
ncbi:MAG: DPP IV N-terminal domain-containing protein [Prevotella sp.]|nr:DPP IV N-terminal domain-containing protein [Prevotella sp.]